MSNKGKPHTSTPRTQNTFDANDISPVIFRPIIAQDSPDKTHHAYSYYGHPSHDAWSFGNNSSSTHSFADVTCSCCGHPGCFIAYPCSHWICYDCVRSSMTSTCSCGSSISALIASNPASSMSSMGDSMSSNQIIPFHPAITVEWAIYNMPFYDLARLAMARDYVVIKLSNIPWDCTCSEIEGFLGKDAGIVSPQEHAAPIHFIMARSSGKTMDCYVELYDLNTAIKLIAKKHDRVLRSRRAEVVLSSQSELLAETFPRWKGNWRGIRPIVTEQMIKTKSILNGYITEEECAQIIAHAKTYRFPWYAPETYSVKQRNTIYHAFKAAIQILRFRMQQEKYYQLNIFLLHRMTQAAMLCVCFTEKQRFELYEAAGIICPAGPVQKLVMQLSFTAIGPIPMASVSVVEIFAHIMARWNQTGAPPELGTASMSQAAKIEILRLQQAIEMFLPRATPYQYSVARIQP